MAKQFLKIRNGIDLGQLSSAPSDPVNGSFYYDTTLNTFRQYRNGSWLAIGSGDGTVTSVAASVPSFLSVAGSPVTTSGTLAISYSGTALPLANGGTGLTSAPASGQILIGNAGGTAYALNSVSGDITLSATGVTAIGANKVTNSQLAQMATLTIKGNNTGGTADALDLTVSQVNTMLGTVTTVGSFGSSPNANGASISGNTLTLQPADGTNPGGISTGTQTLAGAKTFSTSAATPSFLLNGSSSGAITMNAGATVTDYTLVWPSAQSVGAKVLQNDGSGNLSWSAAGSGTVTSVALTVPSFLSVAGSPVTTSGTLAVSLATQSANTVFAGPTSGSAAAPTFRSLVQADIGAHNNYVANGNFLYSQRFVTTATTTTTKTYVLDRWWGTRVGTAGMTLQQVTASGVPNATNACRVQRASGNSSTAVMYLTQDCESNLVRGLAGKTVTLSFYALAGTNYSPTSSAMGVSLVSGTGTDQTLDTGYTGSTSVISSSATLTTSYQKFTFTGTVPSNATQLGIQFSMSPTGTASTNDYFDITSVQLNEGPIAFDYHHIGDNPGAELAYCQRFYQKSYQLGTAPSSASFLGACSFSGVGASTGAAAGAQFKVVMRATPTMFIFNPANGTLNQVYQVDTAANVTVTGANQTGASGFPEISASATLTANKFYYYQWVALTEL